MSDHRKGSSALRSMLGREPSRFSQCAIQFKVEDVGTYRYLMKAALSTTTRCVVCTCTFPTRVQKPATRPSRGSDEDATWDARLCTYLLPESGQTGSHHDCNFAVPSPFLVSDTHTSSFSLKHYDHFAGSKAGQTIKHSSYLAAFDCVQTET